MSTVVKSIGWLILVLGVISFFAGLLSVVQNGRHHLVVGIYWGGYFIPVGYGLIRLKKWGIVGISISLIYFATAMFWELISGNTPAPFITGFAGLLPIILLVLLLSQWKRCTWV